MNISSVLVFGGLIGLGIMGIISMINTRRQLRQFEKTINRIVGFDSESESDKQSKRDKEYLERTNRVLKSMSTDLDKCVSDMFKKIQS